MPLIPATFLAGALLTLLLPIGLLVALTVWYVMFIRRVPETAEAKERVAPQPAPGTPAEAPGPSGEGP